MQEKIINKIASYDIDVEKKFPAVVVAPFLISQCYNTMPFADTQI